MTATEPPFEKCPACGTPQIADAHALVLYFPSVEDCREVAALPAEALPQRFTAYTVEPGDVHKGPADD